MIARLGSFALALLAAGCGPAEPALHPVSGRVVFRDGTPVKAGVVEFEPADGGPAARAAISSRGQFTLKTGTKPGAVAGRHRVAVVQTFVLDGVSDDARADHARHAARIVDRRFARFDTSGLVQDVQPGSNALTVEVVAAPGR